METSNGLQLLSQELSKLPGIGQKTATRLAYYLLNQPEQTAETLAGAIVSARKSVRFCRTCQTLTDRETCPICSDSRRDHTQIMVVETPQDLEAYERTGSYKGVYHVLHGVFSPMRGINLSEIRYKELLQRVAEGPVSEVIIATGSSLEGETTAVVINNEMNKRGIRTTRIASGIPVGVDLENTDSMTLSRALEDRRAM